MITVVHNAVNTIKDCIDSVHKQGVDSEHYVVDGCSSDGTQSLLKTYKNENIINYSSEPDDGIYDAMNKGIESTIGDIVGILNADDFYAHDKVLQRVINVFKNPDIDACYGDLVYIDSNDKNKVVRTWSSGFYTQSSFRFGWMPPHPTFFVRRSVYEKYGGFDLSLGSAADYELMLRFLYRHKIKAQYIPETLIKMRTGGVSNVSLSNRLKANRMDKLAWKVNYLKPAPWTLFMKPMRKITQFSFL